LNIRESQLEMDDATACEESSRSYFQRNLTGEYLAMALMLQAVFGIVGWSLGAWYVPEGVGIMVAGVWILCRARGVFAGRWFSPLVTTGLACVLFAMWQADTSIPHASLKFFSPIVFLAMLLVILIADVAELTPWLYTRMTSLGKRLKWKQVTFWSVTFVFVVYMILIPTSEWITNQIFPSPSVRMREYMSLAEMVRLRSMEAFSALWFFALGATIGSFLNVVAYRVPRGESVIFQRSRCPQCGTQIKGRDNVPIFGWVMLSGRCRTCQSKISARYPIVETITALLFLALYFVELISGGANIPVRQPNSYSGVVWILMYTKWDLVGMYLYHCLALCVLLSCVLIDIDGKLVNSRTRWFVAVMLLAPPLIWPDLMPVPFIADAADLLPMAWLRAGTQCLLGGLMGVALGSLMKWGTSYAKFNSAPMGQVLSFLAVVGITLGWQAVIAVTAIGLLMRIALSVIPRFRRWPLPLTAVLLASFVTHQLAWRWTIEHGSLWWPSHLTSVAGWVGVVVAMALLLLTNRFIASGKIAATIDAATAREEDEPETSKPQSTT